MYAARLTHGPVDLAFTDRYDGVSASPFDALNLGLATADDPASVAENYRLLLADFAPGARFADMRQVHGADVVDAAGSSRPACDGLVTTTPDLVLVARAADCVPVVLADAGAGVVGVAHAGRQGVLLGILPAVVRRMRERGATSLTAWVGPHVCGGCYEVPAEMRDQVAAVEPAAAATTTWGTPALDLGAGVRAQLERADVAVVDLARCTRESADLYSHRRDGAGSGRFAGLVRLRAPGAAS